MKAIRGSVKERFTQRALRDEPDLRVKMSTENKNRVCPVERAGGLDTFIRRIGQNPRRLLKSHVRAGMTVLDLGCGPGFFTLEMARMLDGSGKVIAADLQQGMLDKVRNKIRGTELARRIELHRCQADRIGVREKTDFVLAFYVIHEIPDHDAVFEELRSMSKPEGKLYIVEPKHHVSKHEFETMVEKAGRAGFSVASKPRILFSRAVVLAGRADGGI
jgi:ubiquinone/menaquinone biosynthesis C-methylase UbiE